MTHLEFIALLGVYAVVVALTILAGRAAVMPAEISKAQLAAEEIYKRQIKRYLGAVAFANVAEIGLALVGFIGMLFLWHIAPYIFVVAIFMKVFPVPFTQIGWFIMNKREMTLAHLQMILDGAILVVVFFGPARHLFFQ